MDLCFEVFPEMAYTTFDYGLPDRINSAQTYLESARKFKQYIHHEFNTAYLEAPEIVLEDAVNGIITKIRNIIDKVVKFVSSIYNRCINAIAKFVQLDSYLVKHKDAFKEYAEGTYFNGYIYTFEDDIPNNDIVLDMTMDPQMMFLQDYVNRRDVYGASRGDISTAFSDYIANLSDKDIDRHLERARARILNAKISHLTKEEYNDMLFKTFRDGQSEKINHLLTKDFLNESLNLFINFGKVKSNLKKEQTRIESEYNKLKENISKIEVAVMNSNASVDDINSFFKDRTFDIKSINGIFGREFLPYEIRNNLGIYFKTMQDLVVNVSNLHLEAIGAKLDAYKEWVLQSRPLLHEVLDDIYAL